MIGTSIAITNVRNHNQLLLDQYSGAAAAYSLRKLRNNYSGSAIRVRRSSDNAETDIGFNGAGNLDETALTTFTGANDGYVTTWYDQSGNGDNATQTTASAQPKLISSGAVNKVNGKPSILFDGLDDYLQNTTSTVINQPLTKIVVAQQATSEYGYVIDGNATYRGAVGTSVASSVYYLYAGTIDAYTQTNDGNQHLYFAIFDGASSQLYANGVGLGVKDIGAHGYEQTTIGAIGILATYFTNVNVQEVLIYGDNKILSKAQIESNINNYYSVY